MRGLVSLRWVTLLGPLFLAASACVDESDVPSANAEGGAGGAGGVEVASGGAQLDFGAAGSLPDLDPPPPPGTADVAQPDESVDAPNLQVLPWAGFSSALSYTFDDTQPSQVQHWPELKATGVRMTFFANPSASSQAGYDTNWTAVAAAGSEIGNHTWSHCYANLSSCTPIGTAEEEIDQATDYIVSHLGVPAVYSFASPYGDSGWVEYAETRFLLGRGVASGTVPASGMSNWYNLPVFPVAADQTAADFNTAIESARSQGRWAIFMFHSIRPTSNDWWAGVDIADITASLEHAQSFGDVWLDTFTSVGAYARAQQMFEALTPDENTWEWSLPEHFPPGKVLRVTVDGGTLTQRGQVIAWDEHGYYEVALDAGSLAWSP